MNRFLLLLTPLLLLIACGKSKTNTAPMVSQGMPGEVLIIAPADDQPEFLLDSGIGGLQAGLFPAEPRYRCALLKPEDATGDAIGAALIVLVKSPKVNNSKLNSLWKEAGEKAVRQSGVAVAKDVWATGQYVFLVEPASDRELRELASARGKLADMLFQSECGIGLYGGLLPNKYSDSVMNRVEGDFGFRFPLPPQFRLVQSNKEMLWFIWEGRDFRANLWVNIVPGADSSVSTESMLRVRDSFAARYVKGSQGMPMMSSRSTEYPTFESPLDKIPGWRGWWTISGQWQRGPYRRFLYRDVAGERSVWLEGFLEAPEIPNNPYYRMFDLIANGFRLSGTSLSAAP